jgi:hypothetical protein
MLMPHGLILAAAFFPAGDLPSGPQVGDKLPDFKTHAHTGPDKGKEFKIHDKTKSGAAVVIFMHAPSDNAITRPGFQFLKPVDKYASEQEKLASHIVWVTGDKDKVETWLTKTEALGLNSPVSICLEGGKDGPATYALNDKVQITVLVCKDNKVVANFALVDPSGNDTRKVVTAIAKVLGKDPPKEEKKVEKKREEKKGERSPELQKLMRQMIQKDNTEEMVKSIADEMRKWAGRDEAKLKVLRAYAAQIVEARYGTEAAQAALKKLAE